MQFTLRWRTETEVVDGIGEETCGNTRCKFHPPLRIEVVERPKLKTLELPFAYEEGGEAKQALVKMVLCEKCVRKLMWKRNKDKERAQKKEKTGGEEGETQGKGKEREHGESVSREVFLGVPYH